MTKEEYYNDLIKAASKWNKTEIEVYRRVSEKIDKILKEQEGYKNKRTTLKALIAYFEGKSSRVYYSLIMQIAYAVLIAAISILLGDDQVNVGYKVGFGLFLVLCAMLLVIFSLFGRDFEQAEILYILKDKLCELEENPPKENQYEQENSNKDVAIFECKVVENLGEDKEIKKFLVKISR